MRVYPLKSAAGIRVLGEWPVGPYGLQWDHHWMVARESDGRFVSQRSHPQMALIQPVIEDNGNGAHLFLRVPEHPTLTVPFLTEGDRRYVSVHGDHGIAAMDQGAEAARVLSSYLGIPVRLVCIAPESCRTTSAGNPLAFHDGWQVLGISAQSLEDLNGRLSLRDPVTMSVFRPQLIFEGCSAYVEDDWLRVRVGNATLDGQTLCSRCAVPDIDQSTGERRPGSPVFRGLLRYRGEQEPDTGKTKVFFGRNFDFGPGTQGMLVCVGQRIDIIE